MLVFFSQSFDPALNLSIEKWLLNREDLKDSEVLLFYRNSPSVILGRFQNPWLECDLQKMADSDVSLIRRESGGGTVYHDEGNLNFSFMAPKDRMIKEERTRILLDALRSFKLNALQGQRNDIYIEGKKVSGSAGRYTSKRALHHGTLLINTDLNRLHQFLIPGSYKTREITSKGTESIESPVANISRFSEKVDFETISHAVIEETSIFLNAKPEYRNICSEEAIGIEEIKKYRDRFISRDWTYGRTPGFKITYSHDDEGERRNYKIEVQKGDISNISNEDGSELSKLQKESLKALLNSPADNIMIEFNRLLNK